MIEWCLACVILFLIVYYNSLLISHSNLLFSFHLWNFFPDHLCANEWMNYLSFEIKFCYFFFFTMDNILILLLFNLYQVSIIIGIYYFISKENIDYLLNLLSFANMVKFDSRSLVWYITFLCHLLTCWSLTQYLYRGLRGIHYISLSSANMLKCDSISLPWYALHFSVIC